MPPLVLDGTNGVSGVDGTASNPSLEGTDSNTGVFFPAADTVAIATGGTERVRVDSAGNMGIGTSSPSQALDIAGGNINTSSTAYLMWGGSNSYAIQSVTGASGYMRAFVNGAERMRLDASGNLVLGTTASLSSAANRIDLTINGTSSAMLSFGTGGTRRGYTLHDGTDFTIASETAGALRFLNNGAERARITSGGDFLVGTTSSYAPITNTQIRVQAANAPGFLVMDRATVAVGNECGRIVFGADLTSNRYSSIAAFVPSGAAGVDITDLRFYTMNGGSSGPTIRAQITNTGQFIPGADNTYTCGQSGTRWSAIWAANGTIQTSDARQKNTITDSDLGLAFISGLRPVSYKWNVGQNIVSKDDEGNDVITPRAGVRTHYGLIAQEVKEALGDKDFGGFIHDSETDEMGLRYDQFISPLIKAIQELKAELDATKAKVAALENA